MKRKFADMNSDSDNNETTNLHTRRKRRRRQKIIDSPTPPPQQDSPISVSFSLSDDNLSLFNDDDEIDINKPKKKYTKKLQQSHNKWNCGVCTFANLNRQTKCQMCNTNRNNPSSSSVKPNSATSTISDTDSNDDQHKIIKKKTKFKKQLSIVDLTQINDNNNNNSAILTKKKKKKFILGKSKKISPKIRKFKDKNKKSKKIQRKLPFVKKNKSSMSKLNDRSRERYYQKKIQKKNKQNGIKRYSPIFQNKNKKKKRLKRYDSIESIGSIDANIDILNYTKRKSKSKSIDIVIDNDSDDDVIIINSKDTIPKRSNKNRKNGKSNINGDGDEMRVLDKDLETQQWIDKYAPSTMDELYLHKKKLSDIDKWFSSAFNALNNCCNNNQFRYIKCILFLVGQSGCGKTSAIKCLCNKYNASLIVYPSLDSNIKIHQQSIWDNNETHFMTFESINKRKSNLYIRDESQMSKFKSFLNITKRTKSLFHHDNDGGGGGSSGAGFKHQVILIKELPYVGSSEYLYRFREIVDNLCNTCKNIIVFEVTTEFEGTRDGLNVFGPNILLHPRVSTIRFNGINKTLMKKCLNNILIAEKLKKCISNSDKLINNIIQNEKGDLRNAIQTLQMKLVELLYYGKVSGFGSNDNNTKSKFGNKYKKRKKKVQMSALQSINIGGKEETLSLFHSLGKVLYAKKEIAPEEAIEKSDLDCIMFNDLLFENFGDFFIYNQHFNTLNDKNKGNKLQEFDEWGFPINDNDNDDNNDDEDDVFSLYCSTLNKFSDADICSSFYNQLKYSDTSTDLRSTINNLQFGSQLYPSLYTASIGSRGYLLSHKIPPKLKYKSNNKSNKLNKIRGSTSKIINNLNIELIECFNDILIPKKINSSNMTLGVRNRKDNKQIVSENELSIIRTLVCNPTSLYTEIFPFISYMNNDFIQSNCCNKSNCISIIKTSNIYSQKYEFKSFAKSRFDYLQKSIQYNEQQRYNNNNNGFGNDDDNDDEIEEIEDFD